MPVDDPAEESTVVLRDQPGTWFDSPTDVLALVFVSWFLVFGGRLVLPALALQIQRSLCIDAGLFELTVRSSVCDATPERRSQ